MKFKNIPKCFLWGASSSAFQVEGAYLEDGKKLSIADVNSLKKSDIQMDTKISSDMYHHYEEDVKLMKECGLKSYRFSINWTRIYPNGDEEKPNEKGLAFYDTFINSLVENGITPIVTIYHFDQPYHLIEKYGGWTNEQSIEDYFKYAKCLIDRFGDRVKHWITINEQSVMVFASHMLGIDQTLSDEEKYQLAFKANLNMWLAQAKTMRYLKETHPESLIGPAVSYLTTLPDSRKSKDLSEARFLEDFHSYAQMDVAIKGVIPQFFLTELKKFGVEYTLTTEMKETLKNGTANWCCVNWYCTTIVKCADENQELPLFKRISFVKDKELKYTDWGWNFDPKGLRLAMREFMFRYGNVPVCISEIGWSEKEEVVDGKIHDVDRIDYIEKHVEQLDLALADGVNIVGMNLWSFQDLLSVGDGENKRYGLVYVDFQDNSRRRIKKDSFTYYQELIKKH